MKLVDKTKDNKLVQLKINDEICDSKTLNGTAIWQVDETGALTKAFQNKEISPIIRFFKEKKKIVFLDRQTIGEDVSMEPLEQLGHITYYDEPVGEGIIAAIKDAQIVITNKVVITQEILNQVNKLELICVTATGFNHVDVAYANRIGVKVCNVKGYSTNSVAQHTFALLLDLYHKNAYYHDYISSGCYSSSSLFTHFGRSFHELAGKKWGVVGMGDIGRKVASIAEVFGCEVQYYSTSGQNNQQNYKQVDFDTLLTTSDIISIHAPLNENTENLFDTYAFKKMKPTSYLINVGRGKIISEIDLTKALDDGEIAGAGLDVFECEPFYQDSPLLTIQDKTKLIMTPHIAWASIEARNRVIEEVALNITAYLLDEPRNIL